MLFFFIPTKFNKYKKSLDIIEKMNSFFDFLEKYLY